MVAFYRGPARNWFPRDGWHAKQDAIFSRPTLPDGKATTIPNGKRFKSTYRRIERRRLNHAIRVGDLLTATAPRKRCLWADAWF